MINLFYFLANHATRGERVMEIIRKCRCRLWILWALSNGSHKTIMGSVEWCEEKMEMMRKRVYFILSRDAHVNLYWFSLSVKVTVKVIDISIKAKFLVMCRVFFFRGTFPSSFCLTFKSIRHIIFEIKHFLEHGILRDTINRFVTIERKEISCRL